MAAHSDFSYLHRLADSESDHRTLEHIARLREAILRGAGSGPGGQPLQASPAYLELTLGGERLVLREELAAAALDTFLEIFRDDAHRLHPEFSARGKRRIIDLGANEGYYSLRMKRENPQIGVLAVEPYPPAFDLLQRCVAANALTGVTCLPLAVSEREGPLTLESYPHVSSVTSRNLQAFPRPWIRPERIERRQVPSAPLPEILQRAGGEWTDGNIDLLKLDIEGAEAEALRGAETVLPRIARIVVECHGREVRRECIDFLGARGFSCVLQEEKRSGDAYFLRSGSGRR